MKRTIVLLAALLLAAGIAAASPYTYIVRVNTPDFGVPGWIDFNFVQVNSADGLSATATIYDITQSGLTLDGVHGVSDPAITGSWNAQPIVLPNDVGANNYYDEHVVAWGGWFSFLVTFSGPAVGNPLSGGNMFLVSLYDENFQNFLAAPLSNNEVANVILNADTTLTANGSTFEGGSATSGQVPEPGTVLLGGAALGLILLGRLRLR